MVDNFANLANRSGEGRRITAPTIRNYWHSWQLKNNSQDCQSANRIGTFGYAKQIAKIAKTANGPTARPLDRSTARPLDRSTARPLDRSTARRPTRSATHQAHAPGMDRYADQIGQSFCLLDRFLQLAFCWRSPPPGPTA
jgi:hypothetical protein